MRKLYVLIFLAAFGCTTVADLREKTPFIDASSSKAVNEISACVVEQWSSHERETNMLPRQAGQTITLTDRFYSSPIIVVSIDIDDKGPARSVKVYTRKGEGTDKLRGEVMACI